jgi:hypothetical protein
MSSNNTGLDHILTYRIPYPVPQSTLIDSLQGNVPDKN